MKYGKIAAIVLAVCCISSSMCAMAADDRLGSVVDGSLLTDAGSAELIEELRMRGTYLCGGSGGVSIVGGRKLNLYGSTNCYRISDEVKVRMYLQRLEGDLWQPVYTLPTKTAYNTAYVSNEKQYSVTGGYYYRAYGAHTAIKGSIAESITSYSDGIWVY